MKVVISCQHCIRQYEVDPGMHGKLGRCDICKSYFAINVAELAMPGECIIFDHPIEPYYVFMHEAVSCLARNVRDLLRMAHCAFDRETALLLVSSLPEAPSDMKDDGWKRSFFGRVHRRAFDRSKGMGDCLRYHELTTYFLIHLTGLYEQQRLSLIGAFNGMLSVEFETPPRTELVKYRRRGWLERFAERMGL